MRDLHSSFEKTDLVEGLDIGGETSMDTENFTLDDGADAKIVEHFGAILPGVRVSIFSDSLVVEPVHSGNLPGLVVASEEGDVAGVLQLEAQEQLEGLH